MSPTLAERGQIPPGAKVSEHFSFAELTATEHRDFLDEQEDAPPAVRMNLVRLAVDLLEPARGLVGPLRVSSGYRCPGLNRAIGGALRSAHLDGLAADVVPVEMSLRDAYERILQSSLPFDQLIFERGRWIHLAAAHHAQEPRRQALMMWEPGKYERYAASDPRVRGGA